MKQSIAFQTFYCTTPHSEAFLNFQFILLLISTFSLTNFQTSLCPPCFRTSARLCFSSRCCSVCSPRLRLRRKPRLEWRSRGSKCTSCSCLWRQRRILLRCRIRGQTSWTFCSSRWMRRTGRQRRPEIRAYEIIVHSGGIISQRCQLLRFERIPLQLRIPVTARWMAPGEAAWP